MLAPIFTGNLIAMPFMWTVTIRTFVVGAGVSQTEKTHSSPEE